MKFLVYLIIALFLAVGIALIIEHDPGYVLVTVDEWTIETSVAVFVVVVLAVIVVAYKLLDWLAKALDTPQRMHRAQERRRIGRANTLLSRGLTLLAEGRWKTAERVLAKSAQYSDHPEVCYLNQAKAAHAQGLTATRDRYLHWAQSVSPESGTAVTLTKADLQLRSGDPEAARQTLTQLFRSHPSHPFVMQQLFEVYRDQKDWEHVWDLLPQMRSKKLISEEGAQAVEKEAAREVMAQRAKTLGELSGFWRKLPKRLKHDEDLVLDYAGYLQSLDSGNEAERVIREALERHWAPQLVLAYGEVSRADSGRQMQYAETWSRTRENDPELLLTLGRLAKAKHHWEKARRYFEKSLALKPDPYVYHELGALLEQLGEQEAARECYRRGLALSTGRQLSTESNVLESGGVMAPVSAGQKMAGEQPAAGEVIPAAVEPGKA